jgi:hypothetical protein
VHCLRFNLAKQTANDHHGIRVLLDFVRVQLFIRDSYFSARSQRQASNVIDFMSDRCQLTAKQATLKIQNGGQ